MSYVIKNLYLLSFLALIALTSTAQKHWRVVDTTVRHGEFWDCTIDNSDRPILFNQTGGINYGHSVWRVQNNDAKMLPHNFRKAGYAPNLVCTDINDNIYAVTNIWDADTTGFYIYKYDGTSWSDHSILKNTSFVYYNQQLVGFEAASNGSLFVAFERVISNNPTYVVNLEVWKVTGPQWTPVGSTIDVLTGSQSLGRLKLDRNGIPHIFYINSSGKPIIKKFTNTWTDLNSNGINSVNQTNFIDLDFNDSNQAIISYVDSGAYAKIKVLKANQWVDIGSPNGIPGFYNGEIEYANGKIYTYGNYRVFSYDTSWTMETDSFIYAGRAPFIWAASYPTKNSLMVNSLDQIYILSEGNGNLTFYTYDSLYLGANAAHLKEKITVMPNPSSGNMHFTLPEDLTLMDVKIYSIKGQRIETCPISAVQSSINCSELPSGIYILRFEFEEGMVSKKIIIN